MRKISELEMLLNGNNFNIYLYIFGVFGRTIKYLRYDKLL